MTDDTTMALSSTITLSDEQAMLMDTAVAFCRDKSPIARVRALLDSESGFDADVWDEMAALGWLGLAVDELHGGSGIGIAAAVPIVEAMGRHLLASPFLSTQQAVAAVAAGGSEAQCAQWLPRLAQGSIGTVAVSEDDGSWQLQACAARGVREGAGVRLSGTKTFVTDAAHAQLIVVSCRLDDAPALALLDADDLPAQRLQREQVVDETRRSYRLMLDGLELPATAMITGDAARAGLQALREVSLLLLSAEACGGMNGVLDLLVEYLNARHAFGNPIGAYQALKHPTVDILVGLERTRSHVWHAASLLAADEPAEVALRMAKASASDAFAFAGDRAIQFHGGFGFTWECDAQLYLRRALWCQYQFGDAPHHRRALAELLLPI